MIFFLILFLIISFSILGFSSTVNFFLQVLFLAKIYRCYFYYLLFILSLSSVIYFIINLYVLHLFSKSLEKKDKIFIPKTLPEFLIKKLETLELISKDNIILKEVTRMYYIQINIYLLFSVIYLFAILYF